MVSRRASTREEWALLAFCVCATLIPSFEECRTAEAGAGPPRWHKRGACPGGGPAGRRSVCSAQDRRCQQARYGLLASTTGSPAPWAGVLLTMICCSMLNQFWRCSVQLGATL